MGNCVELIGHAAPARLECTSHLGEYAAKPRLPGWGECLLIFLVYTIVSTEIDRTPITFERLFSMIGVPSQ